MALISTILLLTAYFGSAIALVYILGYAILFINNRRSTHGA